MTVNAAPARYILGRQGQLWAVSNIFTRIRIIITYLQHMLVAEQIMSFWESRSNRIYYCLLTISYEGDKIRVHWRDPGVFFIEKFGMSKFFFGLVKEEPTGNHIFFFQIRMPKNENATPEVTTSYHIRTQLSAFDSRACLCAHPSLATWRLHITSLCEFWCLGRIPGAQMILPVQVESHLRVFEVCLSQTWHFVVVFYS